MGSIRVRLGVVALVLGLVFPFINRGWSAGTSGPSIQGGSWGCSNKSVATAAPESPPAPAACAGNSAGCLPEAPRSDIGICANPPLTCTAGPTDPCQDFLNACLDRPFAKDLIANDLDLVCQGETIQHCAIVKKELTEPQCLPAPEIPEVVTCNSGNLQGECADDAACREMYGSDNPQLLCNHGCCGFDEDFDGLIFQFDNCPLEENPLQADCDGDGIGDRCDHCPRDADFEDPDMDFDGRGDACDSDRDGDGTPNEGDNCPRTANFRQEDSDGDGIGDACDDCAHLSNPAQTDTDFDGKGDGCDNCPSVFNPGQGDSDQDGKGDVCEDDVDNDGISGAEDNCPNVSNPDQSDRDRDGKGDVCDNCPDAGNPGQEDIDRDGIGDLCDSDSDGDRVANDVDNCPSIPNPEQKDYDDDGVGDSCDNCVFAPNPGVDDKFAQESLSGYCGTACAEDCMDLPPELKAKDPAYNRMLGDCYCPASDQDGDLVENTLDNCPAVLNPDQGDMDFDRVGDACDNCPGDPNPGQEDADADGVGDACDGPSPAACPLEAPACSEELGGETVCDFAARQFGFDPLRLNCVMDCCVFPCSTDEDCLFPGAPPLSCRWSADIGINLCDF